MSRTQRIQKVLELIHTDPIFGEPYEITDSRNIILMKTAILLYINDFINEDNYSKDGCLDIIMKESKGHLNPKVIQNLLDEVWIYEN